MKKPARIFTYIITILNSFVPATVVAFFGSIYILTNVKTGEQCTYIQLYYSSFVYGFIFCSAVSLIYFFLIRSKRIIPRWWSTLLLITISYCFVPLHSGFCGGSELRLQAFPPVGGLTAEALLMSTLGFIIIAIFTKQSSRGSVNNSKKRFKSPGWIVVFSLIQYVLFFLSLIVMSLFEKIQFVLTAKLLFFNNHILRWPLYNPMTEDFISSQFSGLAAHLVFIANSLIWGAVVWLIIKVINRKKEQPSH